MLDPAPLADLGGAALDAVWLPVAAWTALAFAAEAALRLTRAEAAVGLPVRGAALAALPVSLALPVALGAWAPEAAAALTVFAPPAVSWLPEVVVGGGAAAVPAAVAAPPPSLVALGALTALTAVVGGAALARLAGGAVRLGRVRRSLPPAPPEVAAALDAARRRAGVRRPVGVRSAPAGVAPFTVGWRRPVVAVPADLGGVALDVALAHELAHVRRADFAWHAAQRALAAAFVWHPLVWALGRGLDLDRERAADAAVLAACPDRRRTYADLLLRYASLPAPPFALGAGRGDFSLKTRIEAMNHPLSPARVRRLARRGRLAGLLTLALAAGFAATTAPTTDAPPPPPSLSAFSDSTQAAIESVEVQTPTAAPATVTVTLKPGYGRAVAEAVAAEARYPDGDDRLVVRYEGGVVERAIRLDRAAVRSDDASAPAPPRPPAPADTTDEVYEVAEVQPELIGGLAGLQQNVVYPEDARAEDVEGQVVVQFVVDKQGGVENPVVLRSPDDRLAEAAIAAVRQARFRPGMQRGEPVRVRFAVPITFRLSGGDDLTRHEAMDRAIGEARAQVERARDRTAGPGEDGVYNVAEVQPELIGGLAGLQEAIVYPEDAYAERVEGQVVVQFVVNEEGGVVDPVVLRSPDDRLAEAAIAAVRQARFRPGMQRGEPVRVRFAVPITFRLPADEGGEDQGMAPPSDDDLRRLHYSGTDLSLLEDEELVRRTLAGFLGVLDSGGAEGGTATVRYTILPNGMTDVDGVHNTGGDAVGGLAAGLVGMMRFKADRRPPQPYEGATFRLDYQPPR